MEVVAQLTPKGQRKYKKAKVDYRLDDKMLDHRESSASVPGRRGKGSKLSYDGLSKMLGESVWNTKRIWRVFKGTASLSEPEARHLCNTLKIDFNQDDFVTKLGTAPDWDWGTPVDIEDSRNKFVEHEVRTDGKVVLEAEELIEADLPCNPATLRAAVSDGSIPDPFASSDFHLKVSVEESGSSKLQLLGKEVTDDPLLSCRMRFSLYQGQSVIDITRIASSSMDPFYFTEDRPGLLVDEIRRLRASALDACQHHLGDAATPLRLHLHIMLPVGWLSGPLPEAIRNRLGRQVFFGCSKRSELAESAVSQLRSQAIEVNHRLYSGGALSSLNWATVCHETARPVVFDQLFQRSAEVIHLKITSLDSEAHHCHLVGRHALLAYEPSLLFVDKLSSAGQGFGDADVCRRWERLVVIGMPLVLWWRDGTESLSQSFDRLRRVLEGSWSNLCDHLELLVKVLNSQDESALQMQALMAALGIFYEDPLRCTRPDYYRHPLHTTR